MKTFTGVLLTVVILAFGYDVHAQYVGATVSYMKVKPGQNSNYLELEKEAKKLHQARVEKGIITQWHLYRKMYSGTEDPYDYVIVAFNDDYKKTEKPFPSELIDELYSSEEQSAFMKKVGETRTNVKTEYYDQVMFAEGGKPAKFIRINRYYVKPGTADSYLQWRQEIIKPVFEEVINQDRMAAWSLWQKMPYDKKFQFVSVDGYLEFGQWKSGLGTQEIFEKIHPDKNLDEISAKFTQSRTQVNSELWRLVDFVVPEEGQ